jgi:hypothetical protein
MYLTVFEKTEISSVRLRRQFLCRREDYQINRSTIRSWSRQVEAALRNQAVVGYCCRLQRGGRKTVMNNNMESESRTESLDLTDFK